MALKALKWRVACSLFLGLMISLNVIAEEKKLLLVANQTAPFNSLRLAQIRNIFLGTTVRVSDLELKPIINKTDLHLYQVFLQKVAYMSARSYERRLIGRVFRQGGVRPTVVETESELKNALQANNKVTFIWANDLSRFNDIKIIAQLWQGEAGE